MYWKNLNESMSFFEQMLENNMLNIFIHLFDVSKFNQLQIYLFCLYLFSFYINKQYLIVIDKLIFVGVCIDRV